MKRRSFLKNTVIATGMGVMGYIPNTQAYTKNSVSLVNNNKDQKPLFRFLQVNDLHVQSYTVRAFTAYNGGLVGENWYGDTNGRTLWLSEALKNGFFPELDFLLIAGDMVVGIGNGLEGIRSDMEYFNEHFIKQLPIPFYPVIGNHENLQDEGVEASEIYYRQTFGNDKSDYGFVHKGIHFIIFNNSGSGEYVSGKRAKIRAELLEQMLERHPSLPKVLCCHIPVIPVRHKETLSKSFRFPNWITMEPEILQLTEKHRNKILAILSGHIHLSGVACHQSVYQIVSSGLASFPHDMTLYSVFNDRMDVEFIQIPSDLWEPKSNLYGCRRLRRDITDEQHIDHLSYIMGNPSERIFSIPMK
ncbi:MAG: metallophosphoesterase [Proteiniphilum sp.]|nr:metallophosphoesterase [Proteiniphilum sp.]